jgi:SAM-dependent methyltransferase
MLNKCYCCGHNMKFGLVPWHTYCTNCKYERSEFLPNINEEINHSLIQENMRESGLRKLREKNFTRLINLIREYASPHQRKLLDVGAAHGWFVQIASKYFDVIGVEPDYAIYHEAKKKGLNIKLGYFPDAVDGDAPFDIIVFNDVFEHIPNSNKVLNSCRSYLTNNGLLVLNIPTTEGFFYKISKSLQKIGISGPFERMWQKDLPSPHIHYFNYSNLCMLLSENGFERVGCMELASVGYSGLFERIKLVNSKSSIKNLFVFFGILILIPITNLFKSDIIVIIARKRI